MSTFSNNDLRALYEEHQKKQNIVDPVIVNAIVKNFENMVMFMNRDGSTKIDWLVTETTSLNNIEEAVRQLQQIFTESKITIHTKENSYYFVIKIDWSLDPESGVVDGSKALLLINQESFKETL